MRTCGMMALLAATLAFLAFVQCGRWMTGSTLISDAELLARFETSKHDMERLREMADKDGLQGRRWR